jgi:uncharacterized protein
MRIGQILKWMVIGLAGSYLVAVAGMYLGQRRLLYATDQTHISPAAVGLAGVTERVLETPDRERILLWTARAQPGQPTLLLFHGQGDTLAGLRHLFAKYMARGRGIAIMAYRGYSGSSGSPSEAANVADARLAYATLVNDGVAPGDIILYGRSLGTGVAVQAAGQAKVGGVVLDSPYTSIADRAAQIYPWLPVHLLIKDSYDSLGHIGRLAAPLLVLHGEADVVVPVAMGRALSSAANHPKWIVTLPGAGHNDHDLYGSFEAIDQWIDQLRRTHRAN